MVDKRWQVRVAQEAGLSVPRVWPDPAAADIFPVLTADPGWWGAGIRPAADAQELAEQWRVAEAEGGPHFVQQRVHGRTMHVGVSPSREYLSSSPPTKETVQPSSVRSPAVGCPDPAASVRGPPVPGAAGYTGIFCFDFIRTESGEHYFLEVNPRIFGSWMTLQLGGVDLVTGYLYALGLSEPPPSPSPDYNDLGTQAPHRRIDGPGAARRRGAGPHDASLHRLAGLRGDAGRSGRSRPAHALIVSPRV